MADVAQLGIRVDSSGAIKAVADLDRLTASAGKADAATEQLATSTGQVSKAMSPAAQQSRMVAMQLSQVAQQASATGNFVQALAIQLPDMAMGFGTLGIAAGVVASVALPMLVQWLGSTSSAMDTVQKQMDALSDASSAYAAAVKAATIPTQELTDKYGALSNAARGALVAMADVSRVEAIQATADAVASLGDALLQTERVNARQIGGTRALADDFGMAADAAKRFEAALVALEGAGTLRDQAAAAEQARNALIAAYGSVEKMPPTLQQAYKQLAGITVEAASINGTLSKAPSIVNSISAAAGNLAAVFSSVKDQAAGFVGYMQAAYDQALKLSQFTPQQRLDQNNMEYSGRGGDPRDFMNPQANTFGGSTYTPSATAGGGGGADPMQTRIESLRQTLSTERDMEVAHYAQQQADLQAALESRLLTQQEYNGYIQQAEAMHAAKMAEIKQNEAAMVKEASQGMYGALTGFLDMFAGKSKAAAIASIAINKALAIAQIIQNSGIAATRALAELGPVAGPPAAAKILAFGKVQAALVAATGFMQAASAGGGGSVGSIGKTAAAAQGATKDAPQTVEYIVRGIDRTRTYSGEELAMIFDGISEEAAKRGMATFRFI